MKVRLWRGADRWSNCLDEQRHWPLGLFSAGRGRGAHVEFTRTNIALTIVKKDIEEKIQRKSVQEPRTPNPGPERN